MFQRVHYRIQQLIWSLTARSLTAQQTEAVRAVLNPAEFDLFQRFSHNDQQHSWRVMRLLQSADQQDAALLKAALLHDIGKTRVRLGVVDRCVAVLGSLLLPRKSKVWGQTLTADNAGWRRPFVAKQQHPEWGAEMVSELGGSSLLVELIGRHQTKVLAESQSKSDLLLRQLQWADDQN